jgi:predicted negative regulator of RcsB-dependent stress response
MKKLIICFILLAAVAVAGFSATEEVQVYEFLYNASPTHSGQLDILQNMAESRLTGAGEFYAKALRKLVSEYRNIRDVTERNAADEQAMLLSALLGAEKYTQAAADLWLVVDGFSAPLVKSEALMALGKIRATTYLPQVIRVLESVNAAPTNDRLNGERIAFGAIISLEKFQDPSGYLPVFFASTGWYSDRIKSQATKSLPFIAQDPSPYMLQVVKGSSYDYSTKYTALRTIEAAKGVDNKNKVAVAVAALTEGWRSSTNDVQLRSILADMRKMAIGMINRYKSEDEAIYPLLERSYTQGVDTQEKLSAIAALASQGTEESAKRLSSYLMDLNAKRVSGNIRQEEEQMVRAIIPAIGQTGRSIGRPALSAVSASNWTPAVVALANNALKQLR